MPLKTRALHVLIALDAFIFVLLTLGAAYPGETISSAAWRLELQGRWQGRVFRPFIDWLFSGLQAGHCAGAYRNERTGARLPPGDPVTTTTPTTQGDDTHG